MRYCPYNWLFRRLWVGMGNQLAENFQPTRECGDPLVGILSPAPHYTVPDALTPELFKSGMLTSERVKDIPTSRVSPRPSLSQGLPLWS